MAVNTPDCDIRFHSNSYEVLRQCSSVIHPVISSCNQTGFWEFYDEKIERACASFTAVVMKTYKNVFCYMCNHNLNFATVQHDLEQGSSSANIARVSFFALLDLDGDSTETEGVMYGENRTASVEGEREECGDGTIRDPLQVNVFDIVSSFSFFFVRLSLVYIIFCVYFSLPYFWLLLYCFVLI